MARQRTKLYRAWLNIKQRCTNPRNAGFENYGGRGISMCSEWFGSFDRFASDVGEPPSSAHSIDRIDNDRGYEPGNVRWALRKQQANNKRNSRLVSAFGRTMSMSQWADELGINVAMLRTRLDTGWPAEEALSTPPHRNPQANRRDNVYVTIDGERKCVADWARHFGVAPETARYRIRHGWDPVDAVSKEVSHGSVGHH